MPLRFDPASLLAPGGIVSGLDDLGSAVVQAMNRRAERKYALEAEARRRAQQVEDREAGFSHARGMQTAAQNFQAGEGEKRRTQANLSREDQQDAVREADLERIELALDKDLLSNPYLMRKKTGQQKISDEAGERMEDIYEDYTPEEIDAIIAEREARVRGHAARWGERTSLPSRFEEARKSWKKPAAEDKVAPKEALRDMTLADAIRFVREDPLIQEGERSLGFETTPNQEYLDQWRAMSGAGDSPRWDVLSDWQRSRNTKGLIKASSKQGREEVAARAARRAQEAARYLGPKDREALLGMYGGTYGTDLAKRGRGTGEGMFPLTAPLGDIDTTALKQFKVVQALEGAAAGSGTASASVDGKATDPAKAKVDELMKNLSAEGRASIQRLRDKGISEAKILAALSAPAAP